jgi:hypothetical protein
VRLGILTDIHHRPPGSAPDGWHNPHQFDTVLDRLAQSLAWLRNEGVERVAVLGDLAHEGDAESLREVVDVIGESGIPAWLLPGNHDLGQGGDTLAGVIAESGHPSLTLLGASPTALAGDWLVTGLDIQRAAPGGYEATSIPDPSSWGSAPLLLLSHFPVLSTRGEVLGACLKYAGDLTNAGQVAATVLERAAPTLVLSGHLHVRHAISQGPVLQASCGAQVESLFEVTVVSFDNWDSGRVTWTSTAIQPVWPGVNPALSEPTQRWVWDGSVWST